MSLKIKISALDRKFSQYIRQIRGNRCERCKRQGVTLQGHHFYGRRKKSVRFDPQNALCLCFMPCHRWFHENPFEAVAWMRNKLGAREFDLLTIRANTPGKPDYEMIRLFLDKKLKERGAGCI